MRRDIFDWMEDHWIATIIGLIVAVFALGICPWIVQSHFEARAFEHVTGKHVSTWDAMWIELRTMESAK